MSLFSAARLACLVLVFGTPFAGGSALGGEWKTKAQVVWDKQASTLVRKAFRVWDPHPELNLDFIWEPRQAVGPDAPDKTVNGAGTLTWYANGAPNYDRQFTYSVFKGVLKNGRADGQGVLAVRTGLSYTGEWRDGEMDGRGVLRLENGDKYDGDFVAGRMHGVGKYTSTEGSVYFGEFRNGSRDGIGRLMTADGAFRTVWREGREIDRQAIPDGTSRPPAKLLFAAISDKVKLKLSLDQKKAVEFENADPDTETHVYEADYGPGTMTIRLASGKVLDAWKGDAPIPTGDENTTSYILSFWQFAPLFFNVDVENGGTSSAQITSAFLDVAESNSELAPYLELHHGEDKDCQIDGAYNPILDFRNLGWGRVKDARMTYSFGTGQNRGAEAVVQLGDFDKSKKTSIAERLRVLGVNVERLRKASNEFQIDSNLSREKFSQYAFTCDDSGSGDDFDQKAAACFTHVKDTGVFGGLKNLVYVDGNAIYTTLAGHLAYRWTGTDGKTNARTSPIAINIPLVQFSNMGRGEMGCEEPIVRSSNAVALSSDRRKYRVGLPGEFNARLGGTGSRQFAFSLTAPKSSHHVFQLVLQLADGSQVTSPVVDLVYFRPRVGKKQ